MCRCRLGSTKQAVLLGPGLDTRAARTDWPAGTLVMELCPAEAAAAMAPVVVPRHTLSTSTGLPSRQLRRLYSLLPLPAAPAPRDSFEDSWVGALVADPELEAKLERLLRENGFRADRPSVWTLQVRGRERERVAYQRTERLR